jgi:hypothetical protein
MHAVGAKSGAVSGRIKDLSYWQTKHLAERTQNPQSTERYRVGAESGAVDRRRVIPQTEVFRSVSRGKIKIGGRRCATEPSWQDYS